MKEYEFNPNDIEHCLERADALKALAERCPIETPRGRLCLNLARMSFRLVLAFSALTLLCIL